MNFQKVVQSVLMLVLVVTMAYCFVLYTHAEELPDWETNDSSYDVSEPVDSSVRVSAPEISSQLDTIQDTLNQITDVIVPDEDAVDADSEEAAPEPSAVDYSAQLAKISAQLANLEQAAVVATAETASTDVFNIPFSDYSLTDYLLLFGVVFLVCFSIFRFVVDRWF